MKNMDGKADSDGYTDDMIVAAREGKGALLEKNGTCILMLQGDHYEIGYQHGVLLKDEVSELSCKIIEISESLEPGVLRSILKQQESFIPERFLDEMRGIAKGADVSLEDIKLVNIMPELFHCSGIAVFGDATIDNSLYHSRILDYNVEYGLQNYSVVAITMPDGYNSYINATFAGFSGCVTGMNDMHEAIGEIGGEGYGDWVGVPMAFLIKKALEEAETLEQTVDIFRNSKRTCEYYYVMSDSKTNDAKALYATPDTFITFKPGVTHAMLPLPLLPDTLLISGEERFPILYERIKENYGKIDFDIMIEIMKRPVSMHDNLHNAIFHPKTLIMKLAVAKEVSIPDFQACNQEYHEFDLGKLILFAERKLK
jgi:isopenicillin-N N-acyltransferase like protein